jgi:hypothetical protein
MMRGLLMLIVLAAAAEAQQVDTVFPAPERRIVHMSGITGSVEIKTWSRPEVRVQVRGAGVSRVRLDLTASMVVVTEVAMYRAVPVVERGVVVPAPIGSKVVPAPPVGTAVPRPDTTKLPKYSPPVPTVERGRVVDADTNRRVARPTAQLVIPDTVFRVGRQGLPFTHVVRMEPRPPASVDYTITVPAHGGVVVRGSDVEIIVSGTIDTLSLSNVNGSIRASNVSGKLNLSSLNGRILVEGASGDLLARTLGGSIAVRGADATVEAHAGSGTIELLDVRGSMVSATTVDGGISLAGALPANGSVTLSTMRGPLGLPQTGPCSKVFPEGEKLEFRPTGSRLYRLVLTTTAPGNSREAMNCALRRD